MSWVEVSLTVSAEAAEAVADVLAGFAPNGTVISGELSRPDATATVQAFLPAPAASEEVRRRIRESIWHLAQILPLPEPSFRTIEDEDWAESWKAHHHPIAVGRRLQILPTWVPDSDPARIPVRIDPGMAFGTGSHPTTRMCLEGLEDYVRPGDVVVDLGCGSGILSIAAVLLGASRVLACDIDEDAVAATLRNAELNGIGGRLEVLHGSLAQTAARLQGGRPADLLVANILAGRIRALLDEGMAGLVRAGGFLLLSGILNDQQGEVHQAARQAGLAPLRTDTLQDWSALIFRNETPPPKAGAADGSA